MSSEQPPGFEFPKRDECFYTACFCEENIWHLAKRLLETNKNTPDLKCYVIFLSNSNRCVHLWKQIEDFKATDGLLFWDYHVFLITEYQDQTLVFDLNSTLPFPVPFSQYAVKAVKHDFDTRRFFKVIDAEKYVEKFSSDRDHMSEGDRWISEPPPYPPILNEAKESNLEAIICMDKSDEFGEVLNVEDFIARFSRPSN